MNEIINGVLGHLCAHIGLTGPREPSEDCETNEMTLPVTYRRQTAVIADLKFKQLLCAGPFFNLFGNHCRRNQLAYAPANTIPWPNFGPASQTMVQYCTNIAESCDSIRMESDRSSKKVSLLGLGWGAITFWLSGFDVSHVNMTSILTRPTLTATATRESRPHIIMSQWSRQRCSAIQCSTAHVLLEKQDLQTVIENI